MLWLASVIALSPNPSWAADDTPGVPREAWNTGWALYIDDDLLLLNGRDQQYTGGAALTLSGRRAREYGWSLDPVLGYLNRSTGFAGLGDDGTKVRRHSLHIGMAAFTPEDTASTAPIPDDRPYASLAFVSNTRQRALLGERVLYQSSFVLGVLGTEIVPAVQDAVHSIGSSDDVRGWDNQISDGGEPTADYVLARYDTVALHREPGFGDYQIQTGVGGGVGFATQAGLGISARWGRYSGRWWSFVPDYAQYIGFGTPISGGVRAKANDFFLWGDLNIRYNLYNALLEGQFRDSAVTYDRSELDSLVAAASIGMTIGLGGGGHLSLALRARTPEIPDLGDNLPFWGSVVFSQAY